MLNSIKFPVIKQGLCFLFLAWLHYVYELFPIYRKLLLVFPLKRGCKSNILFFTDKTNIEKK
jgi:hypothetical protein